MKEKDSSESEDEELKERLKETTVKRLIRERLQIRLNIKKTVIRSTTNNILTKKILGDLTDELKNENKVCSNKDKEKESNEKVDRIKSSEECFYIGLNNDNDNDNEIKDKKEH